jgi:alpha-L-rhamnosidase
LNAAIPANTTATIYVPAAAADAVTESGRPAASVSGVKFLRMEAGAAVYEVGSGAWQFVSETP